MGEAGLVSSIDDGEDAMAWGVLAGHEASSSRGAVGGAGVALAKDNALACEFVCYWRIDKIATGESHIAPPHIIDEKDDEVGFRGGEEGCD